MQPQTTDIDLLPYRWRNLLPLTGLTTSQVDTVYAIAQQRLPPRPGRPCSLPLAVRVLLVLIHLRTNLTTRALAALFCTSQSAVDRIIHHLVPVLAQALQPNPAGDAGVWIIDGTLIPVHDQTITAISKNYRRASTPTSSSAPADAASSPSASAGPVTATTSSSPATPSRIYSPATTRYSATAATAASTPSLHPRVTKPAASSATTTTAHTAASGTRRTRHRPTQRLADTASMPPPRRSHQPQPPNHRRTLEPQDPHAITGQLLVSAADGCVTARLLATSARLATRSGFSR
jgi:Helix-turn-helix of DDE superfamily endonuclease